MAFPVICISHTDGSTGEGVGKIVADSLGFRYLNEEIILEAARLAQVEPAVVAEAEQKQTLLQRILERLSAAQAVLGVASRGAGLPVQAVSDPFARRTTKDDIRGMIRAAIHEVSRNGKAVIVTHAASMALAGRPGVLRVLVTAPQDVRAERIALARALTAEAATDTIAAGDSGRGDYLRNFYAIDEELPTHYDLVLNTQELSPEQVAALVVAAATA
jgi:cytidylate kinase